jgi:hypothetical protein
MHPTLDTGHELVLKIQGLWPKGRFHKINWSSITKKWWEQHVSTIILHIINKFKQKEWNDDSALALCFFHTSQMNELGTKSPLHLFTTKVDNKTTNTSKEGHATVTRAMEHWCLISKTWIVPLKKSDSLLPNPLDWRGSMVQWLTANSEHSLHMFGSWLWLFYQAIWYWADYPWSLCCLVFPSVNGENNRLT